jgi:hypothetical protein
VEIRVSLSDESNVYVLWLDTEEAGLLYPSNGDKVRLSGDVVLPGANGAWKLTNARPGRYLLVVGIRSSALSRPAKAAVVAAFAALPDRLDQDRVRETARRHFDSVRLLPFTVIP